MEQWEREEENIIKREQQLRKNYVPLSEEQQKKNINSNWMEFIDEDGNKTYEPLIDNSLFIDASDMKIPKEKLPFVPVFLIFLIVIIVICILYHIFLA